MVKFCLRCSFVSSVPSHGLAQSGYSLNTFRGTCSHSDLPLDGGVHRGHISLTAEAGCSVLQTPMTVPQGEQASGCGEGAGLGTSQQF